MQRLIDEDSAAPVPNGAGQLKKKLKKMFYVVCICIVLGLLVFIAVRVGKRHNKEPEELKCYECKNCTNDVDKCADWKAPFESECMSAPRSVETCKHGHICYRGIARNGKSAFYIRGCAKGNAVGCHQISFRNYTTNYCFCNSALCNF